MGRFNFPIDDTVHARARALAALRGTTLRELVEELLQREVDDAGIPAPQSPAGAEGSSST